ncbi:MAG: PKD domain-containing protein, partial [Bacteroidetes bacterium]|nr:PKD domain-containing protein [Bacteroidota bacterium]
MKFITTIFIICLSYLSLSAQDILMQDGSFDQCTGTFFDSGGAGGDYNTSENFTLTLCPDGPNLQTVLEFSSFDLANDGDDQMTIYDADNPDPGAILGTFTGILAGNPELNFIAATNANTSGCLTIVFESNTFFNATGWEAAISCRPPCQTITPEVADISPICSENNGQQFVEVNQPITFVGDATTSSGVTNDLTYEWDFQGTILSGQTVNQTFNNPGTVDASLTVTDSFGCSETLDFTVFVGDQTIIVDDTEFTLDELINDVLISGTCSVVDNIVSPNNASLNGDPFESYGYFNQGCSSFPFEEGVIMATTDVNSVLNNVISGGSLAWPGDPDLETLIQQPGNTNNATVIEFEFTPFVDQIQFNYIFASYEYPEFVCQFADTFAFILSGPGISNTNDYDHDANPATPDLTLDLGGLNIALVPGTNTPVSPTNVHNVFDDSGNSNCSPGDLGEFAFPAFYDATNSLPNTPGDILVDGRTRILTAQADVIPGQVYNIKLAIADRGDQILDSFVFLEGDSFELGANAGEDLTLEEVTAACEGEVRTLEVFDGVAPPGFSFQWTQDGVPIPGETGPTLNVTETGEYCIELLAGSDCDDSDCVQVEFVPVFDQSEDITEDLDLIVCLPFSDPLSFDLTQNDDSAVNNISNTFFNDFPDFQNENPGLDPYKSTYYESQTDAENQTNPIADPANFIVDPVDLPLTIYFNVTDNLGLGCFNPSISVGSFVLNTTNVNIGQLSDFQSCSEVPGSDVATFDLTQNDANVLNGEDPNNFDVSYYESQQDAIDGTNPIPNPSAYQNTTNPQTIWAKQDNLESAACFNVDSFQLEVFQTPD